jgi:predicted dehydrogenase
VNIFGTDGRIEIDIPFNAPPDVPCTMRHKRAANVVEISLEICNQYTIQAERFAQAVLDDEDVPTPLDDGVANMRVIEALVKSAAANTWV